MLRQNFIRLATPSIGVLAIAAALSTSVKADQFFLKDGRVLTGKLVSTKTVNIANPDKKSAATDEELVIELEQDVLLTIRKSELKIEGYRAKDPARDEYETSIAPRMKDTVEDHRKAIKWCLDKRLNDLVVPHNLRIVDLNPDDNEARAAVEHKQSNTGRWERVEDRMRRMGKTLSKSNKWVYPELVSESEQQTKYDEERKKLLQEINPTKLIGPKSAQAMAAIQAIDNPILSEVIAERLIDKDGITRKNLQLPIKLFFIEQLGRFENPISAHALSACTLDDNPQIRVAALDVLISKPNLRSLAVGIIATALRSPDNSKVNLAGAALGRLDAKEAVLPLIGAVVTKHKVQESSGATTYSPEGFTAGGDKPKVRIVDFKNEEVRNALAQITGQGTFGYDRKAWIAWYARLNAQPVEDLRRDP